MSQTIRCPLCGNEITDPTQKLCPHCGSAPPPRKKFSLFPDRNTRVDRVLINKPVFLLFIAAVVVLVGFFATSTGQQYPFDGLYYHQARGDVHAELGSPKYTGTTDQGIRVDLFKNIAFQGKSGTMQAEYDSKELLYYGCWYYTYTDKNSAASFDKPTRERREIQEFSLLVTDHLDEVLGTSEGDDQSRTWLLEDGSTITLEVDLSSEQPVILHFCK